MKLIYLEKERFWREMVKMLFAKESVEVYTTDSFLGIFSLAKELNSDLFLMDLTYVDEEESFVGDFYVWQKETSPVTTVGLGNKEQILRCQNRQLHLDRYISRPISPQELREEIFTVFSKRF